MNTRISPRASLLIALVIVVFISLACFRNLPGEPSSNVTVVPGGVLLPNDTLDAAWGVPTSTSGPTKTLEWSDRWDFNLCSMLEFASYEFVIKDQFTNRDGGFYCSNELHITNISADSSISVYVLSVDNDGSEPVWGGIPPLGPGETDSFVGFAAYNPAVSPPESQILLTKLVAFLDTRQCSWILREDAFDQLNTYVLDQPCKLP